MRCWRSLRLFLRPLRQPTLSLVTPEAGVPRIRSHRLPTLIGVDINLNFSKGQETALAHAALACNGPVLIAWRHEGIPLISNAILGMAAAPQSWPKERFDVVFVFTLNPSTGTYSFAQVAQRLLAGDSAEGV
jgi:hypothetical protein